MFGASFLILLTEPVYRSLLVKRREDISSPGPWTRSQFVTSHLMRSAPKARCHNSLGHSPRIHDPVANERWKRDSKDLGLADSPCNGHGMNRAFSAGAV